MTKDKMTAADTRAAFDAQKAGPIVAQDAPMIGPMPLPDLTDAKAVAAYVAHMTAMAKAARKAAQDDAKAAQDMAKAARKAAQDKARADKAAQDIKAAQDKASKAAQSVKVLTDAIPTFADMFDAHGGNAPRGTCKALRAMVPDWQAAGYDRAAFVKAAGLTGIDPTTAGCQWAQAIRDL